MLRFKYFKLYIIDIKPNQKKTYISHLLKLLVLLFLNYKLYLNEKKS